MSAVMAGQFVRVVVEDDGPGLPPGDPLHLFEKFQRGKAVGTIAGVGLGLAICRVIVQAYGGQIAALSQASGGARFEFTLPATDTCRQTAGCFSQRVCTDTYCRGGGT